MISLGGAIGGLLVGLVASHLLTGYFEPGIGLVACALLLLPRLPHLPRKAVGYDCLRCCGRFNRMGRGQGD